MLDTALLCLALNLYHEARSEDTASQIAVAEVTLNRVDSNHYQISHTRKKLLKNHLALLKGC
jgi:spore germination cell wall hydrolase CwlJ-like protein